MQPSTELQHLDDEVTRFLKVRCMLLLAKYVKITGRGFINANIEKLVGCEKRILQSYIQPLS